MAGEPEGTSGLELWRSFPQDPRLPANAALCAADADRDRIHQVLAQAYAEGRLTRAELEERTGAVATARTLGELPPLVADLVSVHGVPLGLLTPATLLEQATAEYVSDRRQALWGFLSASVICWVIWGVTSAPAGFPWPVFVMLGTGLNVLRTLVMRQDLIGEELRRLERKQAKAERKALSPPEDS